MRDLALEAPGDRRAGAVDDEFGFGPDLLAAPVVTEGARSRRVYLPRGRWIDFARAVRYDADGGFHVAGGATVAGATTRKVSARVDALPLFVRAGAILPLLSPDVDTLSDYGTDVVHLRDRIDRLRLLAFPRTTPSAARAYAGDRFGSRVHDGVWSLSIDGGRSRRYDLEAATAGLGSFTPCAVSLAGRPLPRGSWSFDRHNVLHARFTARRATLAVDGRCGR